ncbi:hypothetical protein [Actinoplanes sp. NBRC 103695]|uniref:hypothetical protein n=1 Tax=Actinoplanes sp. NBRC 103695 TaxID=3032202 RepID=UPI0024A5ECF7|nr:hypothetical protein [Actinoplanes sp. NBRC 103695]GLY96788.1 hypothetical protein Acsp02_40420 [Actinoplanes sp. NBRC 103695]
MTAAEKAAVEHLPCRPEWRCQSCGDEWPCLEARIGLVVQSLTYRTAVLVYLALCLADAAADFAELGIVSDLYDRFLGWVGTGSNERISHDDAG